MSLSDSLKALGAGSTAYKFDGPDATLLERFPNPLRVKEGWRGGLIEISCPEFTSLCPKTGQPDFATIKITYMPREWCVESKSLKLYLGGFRNHGAFHEECVQQIASDLVKILTPQTLKVKGEFTPRGGIPFWPQISYYHPYVRDEGSGDENVHHD